MKKVFLLMFLGLITLPVLAQVVIVPVTKSMDYKALYQAYPNAVGPREQATARDLTFQKLSQDYWTDFYRFLKKKNFRPDSSFVLYTEGFFRADGQAERLHYQYLSKGERPSEKTEQAFFALLSDYLTQRPFPVSSSLILGPFRLGSNLFITKPGSRKTPKGPGLIGDLANAARTTRPDTVKTIAFNGLDLEKVPEVLYRFVNVEEINLSNNYLTSLPAQVTALPKLQRLNLLSNRLKEDSVFFTRNKVVRSINIQKNSLTRVPPSMYLNHRLESLWLGNNDLGELNMTALRHLRRLNDLNLYNVGLTQLPKTFGRLKHIKVLDLYYNKLTVLPRQVSRMKRLEQLAIAYNKLDQLPSYVTKLRRLQVLFVHHNNLSQLPTDFVRLKKLHVLDVSYNSFTVVPTVLGLLPSLEELALNNNHLQEFPDVLLSIKSLKKVYMSSNPLFGREAMQSPYATQIKQLEANNTQVTY